MDERSEVKKRLYSVYEKLYANPSDVKLQETFFGLANEMMRLADKKRISFKTKEPTDGPLESKKPTSPILQRFLYYAKSRPFAPSSVKTNEVTIGKFTFTVMAKNTSGGRHLVSIQCTDGTTVNEFHAYASISELLTWRLCYERDDDVLYKGDFQYKHYDYVQQTMLHVDLQQCIHTSFESLPETKALNCEKIYKDDIIQNIEINNIIRPRLVEPFKSFSRKQYTVKKLSDHRSDKRFSGRIEKDKGNVCGSKWIHEKHSQELLELSKKLDEKFEVGAVSFRYNVNKVYVVNDPTKTQLSFNYDVYVATLVSKEKRPVYLFYAKVVEFQSTLVYDGKPVTKKNKYFPIGLTMSQTCNQYGCYTDYIPAGRYICKFLE